MKIKLNHAAVITSTGKYHNSGAVLSVENQEITEKEFEFLKDFGEIVEEKAEEPTEDDKSLTVEELKTQLKEAGIEFDPKAKKADLQKLLKGE